MVMAVLSLQRTSCEAPDNEAAQSSSMGRDPVR